MDPSRLIIAMVPFVIQQLASPAIQELAKFWDVDKQLGELLATYCRIKNKIGIWEGRREIDGATVEPWLQELEGYLYDTEDLVDGLLLSSSTRANQGNHPIRDFFLESLSLGSTKPLTTSHKIVKIRKDLERLSSRIEKVFGAQKNNSTQLPLYKWRLSDNMPFVSGTGRDQDKETYIEKLTSSECDRSGVSIVGCGGLGKTALARTILVDERVKTHFPLILYASVSGDFRMEDILHKLVENCFETSPLATENLYRGDSARLQYLLSKQRALIVLDDLWSVKDEDWQCFERSYLNSRLGGKILITTPNPRVAEVTKTIPRHLKSMTEKDCIKLIMEIGNLSKDECKIWDSEIEAIANKCLGLPIVANKVGLELSKIKKVDEKKDKINAFKNCNLQDLPEFREVFLSLNLNELKLPFHRKRCFTYCSLFPQDHEFNKDELIQLWEVEGFIQPQETVSSKLAARKECFDDMVSRSILHPLESKDNEQPAYKMHESKHRLAHLLASNAFCHVDEGTCNSLSYSQNIRHLSLTVGQSIDKTLLKDIAVCKRLRTFLLLRRNQPQTLSISTKFFDNLQRLRLLDLSHTNISTLPKPANLSKHLRYLDLSHTEVDELPKHIQYLLGLQVLKLNDCEKLDKLPKELIQVITLTHLYLSVKKLGCLPPNMGKLTNLEVLDCFSVGKDASCKVEELSSMKNLKEIHIAGLDYIKDLEEAKKAMLSDKQWLKTLVLEWNNADAKNADEVFEGLQPHNSLNVLKVRNYGGKLFPTWLVSPRCQLVRIYLDNCPNCQALPSLGQLPLLKILVFRCIDNVTSLDSMFCEDGERVFPCLEVLEFRDMERLVEWTELKAGAMPSLHTLRIISCRTLIRVPSFTHLSCLNEPYIDNCPKLQSSLGNEEDTAKTTNKAIVLVSAGISLVVYFLRFIKTKGGGSITVLLNFLKRVMEFLNDRNTGQHVKIN